MGLGRSIAGRIGVQLLGMLDACITLKCDLVGFPVGVNSNISSPKNKIRFVGAYTCLASMLLLNDMDSYGVCT